MNFGDGFGIADGGWTNEVTRHEKGRLEIVDGGLGIVAAIAADLARQLTKDAAFM